MCQSPRNNNIHIWTKHPTIRYPSRLASHFSPERVKHLWYTWIAWAFLRFPEKIRPNEYCLWEVNSSFYMKIVSLCQSVNSSWKIVVQNTGCVFTYFVADTKIAFGCKFAAPLNNKYPQTNLLRPISHDTESVSMRSKDSAAYTWLSDIFKR